MILSLRLALCAYCQDQSLERLRPSIRHVHVRALLAFRKGFAVLHLHQFHTLSALHQALALTAFNSGLLSLVYRALVAYEDESTQAASTDRDSLSVCRGFSAATVLSQSFVPAQMSTITTTSVRRGRSSKLTGRSLELYESADALPCSRQPAPKFGEHTACSLIPAMAGCSKHA